MTCTASPFACLLLNAIAGQCDSWNRSSPLVPKRKQTEGHSGNEGKETQRAWILNESLVWPKSTQEALILDFMFSSR